MTAQPAPVPPPRRWLPIAAGRRDRHRDRGRRRRRTGLARRRSGRVGPAASRVACAGVVPADAGVVAEGRAVPGRVGRSSAAARPGGWPRSRWRWATPWPRGTSLVQLDDEAAGSRSDVGDARPTRRRRRRRRGREACGDPGKADVTAAAAAVDQAQAARRAAVAARDALPGGRVERRVEAPGRRAGRPGRRGRGLGAGPARRGPGGRDDRPRRRSTARGRTRQRAKAAVAAAELATEQLAITSPIAGTVVVGRAGRRRPRAAGRRRGAGRRHVRVAVRDLGPVRDVDRAGPRGRAPRRSRSTGCPAWRSRGRSSRSASLRVVGPGRHRVPGGRRADGRGARGPALEHDGHDGDRRDRPPASSNRRSATASRDRRARTSIAAADVRP